MLARAGAQTGWLQNALRKKVPRRAIASRFGVRFIGFAPAAPMQSHRNWSEMIRMMFGRALPDACAASSTRVLAATPAPLSKSLLLVIEGHYCTWPSITAGEFTL